MVDEATSRAPPARASLTSVGVRQADAGGIHQRLCQSDGFGQDGRVAHGRRPYSFRAAGRTVGKAVYTRGPDSLGLPGGGLLPPPEHDGAGQRERLARIVSAAGSVPGQRRPPLLGAADLGAGGDAQPTGLLVMVGVALPALMPVTDPPPRRQVPRRVYWVTSAPGRAQPARDGHGPERAGVLEAHPPRF